MLGALFLRNWYIRRELKRVRSRKNSWNIFDAGSGFGQFSYKMAKTFPNATVYSIDVKPEQIEDCNWFSKQIGQNNVSYNLGDLITYRKADCYDLILNTDVLEHIVEDEKVWANFHASLKKDGYLIVTTPSSSEGQREYAGDDFSVIGEHVREGYTKQEFMDKAARAGFQVERLDYTYGPFWGPLAWRLLQRIPMSWLSISKISFVIVVPWIIIVYPVAAFAMWMDMVRSNPRGGGWIFVGKKI